ncbi:MAG TPA: PEP-CTERM sorting domain-containing protein [Terriglobales bacterium]|nr:PEP-CTERM sorting domain-containing protein [Terriglobales bacterium]
MRKMAFGLILSLLLAGSAFAGELIVNGDFESGQLGPWYNARNGCFGTCVSWDVSTVNPHSGSFSSTDVGNLELRQDFTPTAGSDITNVSFWINSSSGFNAFDFFYQDGTDAEFVVDSNPGQWNFEDVTSFLDTTKILTGFSIWGSSPDITTYVDDVSITTGVATPEPSSFMMLGTGLLAVITGLRRKMV